MTIREGAYTVLCASRNPSIVFMTVVWGSIYTAPGVDDIVLSCVLDRCVVCCGARDMRRGVGRPTDRVSDRPHSARGRRRDARRRAAPRRQRATRVGARRRRPRHRARVRSVRSEIAARVRIAHAQRRARANVKPIRELSTGRRCRRGRARRQPRRLRTRSRWVRRPRRSPRMGR